MIIFATGLHAQNNDFLIGAYQHGLRQEISSDSIAHYMKDANFNLAMDVTNYYEVQSFQANEIRPAKRFYSDLELTTDWKFQAEYFGEKSAQNQFQTTNISSFVSETWPFDMKWYKVKNSLNLNNSNLGNLDSYQSYIPNESKYFVQCNSSLGAGYVFDYMVDPWSSNEDFYTLGINNISQTGEYDDYYIETRLRITQQQLAEYQANDVICRLGAKVLYKNKRNGNLAFRVYPLTKVSNDPSWLGYNDNNTYAYVSNEIVMTKANFLNINGKTELESPYQSYHNLRFKLNRNTIVDSFVAQTTNDRMINITVNSQNIPNDTWELVTYRSEADLLLFPTIYYPGEKSLGVDYIRIVDEKAKNMESYVTQNSYLFQNYSDFAGKDEPWPTQYIAHQKIQAYLRPNKELFQSLTTFRSVKTWINEGNIFLENNIFAREADPNNVIAQFYQLGYIDYWNIIPSQPNISPTQTYQYLQTKLSLFNRYFKESRQFINTLNVQNFHGINNRKFYPIIQAYGQYAKNSANALCWQGTLKPPKSMQKVLAYLPLCYDADGLFYFDFTSMQDFYSNNPGENAGQYGLEGQLNKHNPIDPMYETSGDNLYLSESYESVKEANAKILKFAQILKPLNWDGEQVKTLQRDPVSINSMNPAFSQFTLSAYDNTGLNNHNNYHEGYEGFVECAPYYDNYLTYFFLVNRRSEFALPSTSDNSNKLNRIGSLYSNIAVPNIDESFITADPQVVKIQGNNADYGLVDLLTYETYNFDQEIPIDAGDAKLIRTYKRVNSVISSNTIINNTFINHNVTVNSGATLTLCGNNRIYGNLTITVNQGGKLILFQNSENILTQGAKIDVYGELEINNSKINNDNKRWNGIFIKSNALLTINNSEITGSTSGIVLDRATANVTNSKFKNNYQQAFRIRNATLNFNHSDIDLTSCFTGIYVEDLSTYQRSKVNIIGTPENPCIFNSTEQTGTGIYLRYQSSINYLTRYIKCEYVDFKSMQYAIRKLCNYSDVDSIMNSNFNHNTFAIEYTRSGLTAISSTPIKNCTFYSNYKGISLNNFNAGIIENNFDNNDTGIELFYANNNTNISTNTFNNNDISVRMNNSSPLVKNNYFNATNDCHLSIANNSIPNLSLSSYNLFQLNPVHIRFLEATSSPYSANIDLYNGHNDFYGTTMETSSYDFIFSSLYLSGCRNINANGNYWSDNKVDAQFLGTTTVDIISSDKDLTPNIPQNQAMTYASNNRYQDALLMQENNTTEAQDIFRAIAFDQNVEEENELSLALNQITQYSLSDSTALDTAISIFNTVIDSSEVYNDAVKHQKVKKLVNNQKKKVYLAQEDYTQALNLITEEYLNCDNEIDSLTTLMEIELVTLLADTSEQKSAINYKIKHLKPESFVQMESNRNNYWKKIDQLLSKDDESNIIKKQQVILEKNYPNPFNPSTTIAFSLSKSSNVKLKIFNIKGQKIRTLTDTFYPKGKHYILWDGKDENQKSMSSGIYFYQISVDNQIKMTKKCIMIK
jgi:hypothetical protein